jgi:hypothetical protein
MTDHDNAREDGMTPAEFVAEHLPRLRQRILDRCTCTDRDPDQPVLLGHEPDCAAQNPGQPR